MADDEPIDELDALARFFQAMREYLTEIREATDDDVLMHWFESMGYIHLLRTGEGELNVQKALELAAQFDKECEDLRARRVEAAMPPPPDPPAKVEN